MKILFLIVIACVVSGINGQTHSIPQPSYHFCKGVEDIYSSTTHYMAGGYRVIIYRQLPIFTEIKVKLDSVGKVFTVGQYIYRDYPSKFTSELDLVNNIFSFVITGESKYYIFSVEGKPYPGHPPYITSLKINGEEVCKNPVRGYFDEYTDIIKLWRDAPDKFCGRRRITDESLPLIVSGASTRAGHWPWHAAINRLSKGVQKYICGGTLISKFLILTAAHCATIRGEAVNPEILGVVLGKHSLFDIEMTNQGKEVFKVIIHDDFDKRTLNNDIALLKLSTEAIFNNFVQPACIWFDGIYDKMSSFEITGTVVGWGIDQTESLSKNLRTATLPIVPDVTCIRYEPVFYTNVLNGNKFCAGNANGTAACNGDSGGAFLVFVEDDKERATELETQLKLGAWYIKGIVSVTLVQKDKNICDPQAYTVYTDIAKYRNWILNYMST